MPEARTLYPDYDKMEHAQLNARYFELRSLLVEPDGRTIRPDASDDSLHEMVVIMGALRRKSAGPPKSKAAAKTAPRADEL